MTSLNVVLLAAALAAPAQVAPLADSAATAPSAAQMAPAAEAPAVISAPAPAQNSGLPQRAPVARTMEAYWPVFAAFTLVWLGIVAYALSFGRRSAKLAEELQRFESDTPAA